MFKICIIDDCKEDREKLKECLKKYFSNRKTDYKLCEFETSTNLNLQLLNEYHLLFLDIDMPDINGINLAKEIRKQSVNIGIVFVTNFFQYAIDGYSVDAIDYLLKPIVYENFKLKMKRILNLIDYQSHDKKITLKTSDGLRVLSTKDIVMIEVKGHYLYIHLLSDQLTVRGSISKIKEELGKEFELCNSYYLINLSKVIGIKKDHVVTEYGEYQISRTKRKRFLDSLSAYIGGF